MFTVKGWSETALFREWSNQVFDSLYFRKYISYDHAMKCLKYDVDSRNGTKN